MIVSLLAEAAVAVCCSIDRLIFAFNPYVSKNRLEAVDFFI